MLSQINSLMLYTSPPSETVEQIRFVVDQLLLSHMSRGLPVYIMLMIMHEIDEGLHGYA